MDPMIINATCLAENLYRKRENKFVLGDVRRALLTSIRHLTFTLSMLWPCFDFNPLANGMTMASSGEDQSSTKLTDAQKERIEQNRTKAKAIRKARLAAKPYDIRHRARETNTVSEKSVPAPKRSLFDSHGGYILEDGDESVKHNYRYVEDDGM